MAELLTPRPSSGFILWFTGLSGAGKSTLSNALRDELEGLLPIEILDGDEVRTYLSKGLGFSKEDRDTNVRRIGFVARALARNGTPVITAAISPYKEIRAEVRELAQKDGVPFIEVYVRASLEALTARDVKGLYRKALSGEVQHFTGVSDPYEPPDHPELTVQTDRDPVETSVRQIVDLLRARGLIPRRLGPHPSLAGPQLYPVFLRLQGRRVVIVGGGTVAAGKLPALLTAGARVTVVAPDVRPEIAEADVQVLRRKFTPADLDGASYVVAASLPEVNQQVAAAAEERHLFLNAVDDATAASAFLGGVLRRDGVTVAISTDGAAPALAGLLREAIDSLLPHDLVNWLATARELRAQWKAEGIPMSARRPRLLAALNALYERKGRDSGAGS